MARTQIDSFLLEGIHGLHVGFSTIDLNEHKIVQLYANISSGVANLYSPMRDVSADNAAYQVTAGKTFVCLNLRSAGNQGLFDLIYSDNATLSDSTTTAPIGNLHFMGNRMTLNDTGTDSSQYRWCNFICPGGKYPSILMRSSSTFIEAQFVGVEV